MKTSTLLALLLLLLTTSAFGIIVDEDTTDSISAPVSMVTEEAVRPQPALNVIGKDTPNDNGGSIQVSWDLSPDDAKGMVARYDVERKPVGAPDSQYEVIGDATAGGTSITDNYPESGKSYVYRVAAVNFAPTVAGGKVEVTSFSAESAPAKASAQWFNTNRTVVLIFAIVLGFLILWYIAQAKAGKELFIRRIAGLEAVDEAVGRATEMGKKIFYIPGTQDMENIQTIAGVTILGRVAKLAAEYETQLDVPVSRSLVMVTAREIVKEAYLNAGRPDAFNEDMVHYLTDDQFGYAAAIDGMVVREKPATMFYMGAFYAESLILAETGNSIGAIQIAGTAMPAQLPFFVAACDYTLIGEELFAASAYLSKEPKLLGSLKGQDVGKGLILVVILIGVIIQTLGVYDVQSLLNIVAE
ncbi:MAG: fibronectin type III domain-containing protein [Candidatus Zixiibacteriota bacterium]